MILIDTAQYEKFLRLVRTLTETGVFQSEMQSEASPDEMLQRDMNELHQLVSEYRQSFQKMRVLSIMYKETYKRARINLRKEQMRIYKMQSGAGRKKVDRSSVLK